MNKIEINIGLNNNPCTAQEIVMPFVEMYKSIAHSVKMGEWAGADEPTLVMEFYTEDKFSKIHTILLGLTQTLTQDAIAFRFDEIGELVFNENYTGERYPFNEKYFLTIK